MSFEKSMIIGYTRPHRGSHEKIAIRYRLMNCDFWFICVAQQLHNIYDVYKLSNTSSINNDL